MKTLRLFAALVAIAALLVVVAPPPSASATGAAINGSGSTYVGLAMQAWVAAAQTNGLKVNYAATGSPTGLSVFGQSLVDFAGTEAEYSSLLSGHGQEEQRGYQYVPDVAGAVAVMYNVDDQAGRKVDYLRLSRRTVAMIFTGAISRWSDAAITADNNGLKLPDQAINVVYRGGQSGTTALFYDFVQHTAPDVFGPWAARNHFPTDVRIIQLDSSPTFAPKTQAFNGSDQIAQFVASGSGNWSIAYDEFGYAKTYNAQAARIQNQAGEWILPYAANISSALEDAKLRADLSQDLTGVYASGRPDAYPISAYSYLVTQCAVASDRPTCKGPYSNPGVAETLTTWMRYIACEGQVDMGAIGYSPLPANLSQELANSIGRMNGTAPEQLNAGNCANPRFKGQIPGGDAPPDKIANLQFTDQGVVQNGDNQAAASSAAAASSDAAASDAATSDEAALNESAGGGSTRFRAAAPVAYDRPSPSSPVLLPLLLILAVVLVPPLVWTLSRRRRA